MGKEICNKKNQFKRGKAIILIELNVI